MEPFLEVASLRKHYGATTALDGVSFTVAEGEMFGLLGPNGAGKTTLLSIVSCLLDPSDGEARLRGERLARSNREIRRQIGIVPQELAIYGELTARENLEFFGRLYGMGGKALATRVEEILVAIGLEDRAARRVETFSGGMKRRLNLGAALVHGPRLLLLDEPTTGVDPQSRNHLFEEIIRVNRMGVTVVYTSHYMGEVETLCTRVGIMDNGRLIACDSLSNLMRQMDGVIRFRVSTLRPELAARIGEWSDVKFKVNGSETMELECRDVKTTLVGLVAVLNDLQLSLMSLEMEEPNLERVFLHLTGRALRD